MCLKPTLWCLFSPAFPRLDLPLIRQICLSISSLALKGTIKVLLRAGTQLEGLWHLLGEQNLHSVPTHTDSGLKSLKKLAANLHPRTRFALSVFPSLKGLMANCRSLVGWWGCRVYSCVVISDAVTLLLTMPMATLRAR